MSDTTTIVFYGLLGAALGSLGGVSALMMGVGDPVVEQAGSGGVLGLGLGLGLLTGLAIAGFRQRESVDDVGATDGGHSAAPDEAPEVTEEKRQAAEQAPKAVEEEPEASEQKEQANQDESVDGPQPDEVPTEFDVESTEMAPDVAEEGPGTEERQEKEAMEAPRDHGSLFDDMDEAPKLDKPGYQPSFQSVVFAMGDREGEKSIVNMSQPKAAKPEVKSSDTSDQKVDEAEHVSGGFGDLMMSMGSKSTKDERQERLGSDDRVIANGASTNPLAAVSEEGVEPSGPGTFEVKGDDTLASADVDALRDALSQPSESDPLKVESTEDSEAPDSGLDEQTSPNALRNNLLAARMRRREQGERPQRQMRHIQSMAGREESSAVREPSTDEDNKQEQHQITQNTRPSMNILRKPSNKAAGIESSDRDLRVPEPKENGPVMTVRIDEPAQKELLSDSGGN